MSEDELGVEGVADVGDVEAALFVGDFRVEKDVQQHVAEFLADVGGVIVEEGLAEFVGLLDGVGAQGFVGLFRVPGAFYPQDVEGVDYSAERLEALVA